MTRSEFYTLGIRGTPMPDLRHLTITSNAQWYGVTEASDSIRIAKSKITDAEQMLLLVSPEEGYIADGWSDHVKAIRNLWEQLDQHVAVLNEILSKRGTSCQAGTAPATPR